MAKRKSYKKTGILIVVLAVLALVLLYGYSNEAAYARLVDFRYKFFTFGESEVTVDFLLPQHFVYDVSKVSIDGGGASLLNQNDQADIIMLNPVPIDQYCQLTGFQEQSVKAAGSSITYQLTNDYQNWYYYNGAEWALARDCENCANTAAEINEHINELSVESDGLQFKVFMSGGESPLVLKSITINIKGKRPLSRWEQQRLSSIRSAFASECGECDGKVTNLTLRFNGAVTSKVMVEQKEGVVFEGMVSPGANFSFSGIDKKGTLGPEITIYIEQCEDEECDYVEDVKIHTSCSQPIAPGMSFGSFTVISGASRNGGPLCPYEEWDKSDIKVEGECIEPNAVFTITNMADPVIGDMEGPSEYRIYRGGVLQVTDTFQLAGGESLEVVFENPNGDKIELQADQRPGHPQGGYDMDDVKDCGGGGEECPCEGGVVILTVQYVGSQQNATVEVYTKDGVLVSTFTQVQTNDYLTIDGSGMDKGRLGTETTFNVNGSFDTKIHTSCSQDIQGITFGSFYVVSHIDREGNFCGDPVKKPPVAVDDAKSTLVNTPVDIDILANDSDPDGYLVTTSVTINTPPSNGYVNYDPVADMATYTPNQDYTGTDAFVYTVCDNDNLCDSANVTITIGDVLIPPVAVDDFRTTKVNTPIDIDILTNDYDDKGLDPASVLVTDPPVHGTFSVNHTNGEVTYTPNKNYEGIDEFDYQVCDFDALCDDAHVTIGIGEVIPPVAVDDTATTLINTPVNIDILDNDYDTDGWLVSSTVQILSGPDHGSLSVNTSTGVTKYTSEIGWFGTDIFTYRVCDNDGLCDDAKVTIGVIPTPGPPEHPPVALDDNATTNAGTPVDIDIVVNDSDPDGNLDPTSVTVTDFPTDGSVSVHSVTGVSTYTPNAGFYGVDTFVYNICDTTWRCDNATVTITVLAPPVANNDSATTPLNTPVDVSILANDSDADGYLVADSVTILSGPSNGKVTYNSATKKATYTPNVGYTGLDIFNYRVCDNDGFCDDAIVTIGVGRFFPPTAVDDSVTTPLDTPVNISILLNDFDVDGFIVPSTAVVTRLPSNGSVSVNSSGLATYTPKSGFTGIDNFNYEVCDNDGLCDDALVTIFITPPTPGPVCGNGILEPGEGCDDGNTIDGDGCSSVCTPEAPITPPLIVPPAVIPTPPPGVVSPGIGIYDQYCFGRVYTTPNITFVGSVSLPTEEIGTLQFTYTDGASWNNMTNFVSTGPGSVVFNFTLNEMPTGTHTAAVRAISAVDGSIITSPDCAFAVSGDLVFGANQFVLSAQQSPLSGFGVVQFEAGTAQTFYVEAEGAIAALVRVQETGLDYALAYNDNLKLWYSNNIMFAEPGVYHLEVFVAGALGDVYSREINTVYVTDPTAVVDAQTGASITGARATIYARDPATGNFNVWEGVAFGQANPSEIPVEGLSVILPRGEYYVTISAEGYNPVDSLITRVDEQSVVTANIELGAGGLFGIGAVNFPLNVSPLPQETLLPIGEVVDDVIAYTQDGTRVNLLADTGGIPNIMFVYNNWNTEAQEQLDIYKMLVSILGNRYRFLPISTLEPDNVNATQVDRGNYGIDFYKPAKEFYDDYSIISLPQIFILNEVKELLGVVVGSRSVDEMVNLIENIIATR